MSSVFKNLLMNKKRNPFLDVGGDSISVINFGSFFSRENTESASAPSVRGMADVCEL